ncbi:hypothetical protein TNCV_645881 [Trichonephila clavipes]|nr:hypothetical protein TNCV_645881 [Trichonephila clavipes]
MATGSYLTPTYSRSQSEIQGDLHKLIRAPRCPPQAPNGKTVTQRLNAGGLHARRLSDSTTKTLFDCQPQKRSSSVLLKAPVFDRGRLGQAHLVDEYLLSEDIQLLEWPAMSPDLNPTEYAWDTLGHSISARTPKIIDELKIAFVQEWV